MKPLFSVTKKDFTRQTFRSGGKGGQNQNKVESGVRLIHKDSGAVGESREYRDQKANEKAAFGRLVQSKPFQVWMKIETAKRLGQRIPETPEEIRVRVNKAVDEGLLNGDIKVETFECEAV